MNDKTMRILTAIICVTSIYIVALLEGLDGAYLLPVIAVIAGLAGFTAGAIAPNGVKKVVT